MGNVCAKDNTEQANQDAGMHDGTKMKVAAATDHGAEASKTDQPAAPQPADPKAPSKPASGKQPDPAEHRAPVPQHIAAPPENKPIEEVKLPEASHVSDFEETAKMNAYGPEVQKMASRYPPRPVSQVPTMKEFSGLQSKTLRHKVTGDTYCGTVERGVPHGWGYFITKKGEFIEGNFIEGKLQDKNAAVRQITADGTFYEGGFNADHKRHGKGVVITPKGVKTECNSWVNGNLTGESTDTDVNTNKVIFQGGRNEKGYHGPCTFTREDHTITGTWKDGVLTGNAKKVWNNGKSYEGIVDKDHVEEGQGTVTFIDGRKWSGPFSKGLPNGEGTFTSDSGKSSKQTWKQGKRA